MFKLGKKPTIHDPRTFKLSKYLVSTPQPPPSIDYATAVKGDWPMYGNDQYGDCTTAAAGHMIEVWTANASRLTVIQNQAVLDAYFHFNPPPQDNGCACIDVLNYWRKTGIGGEKIAAYASLTPGNVEEAKTAVDLFGCIYLGVELPDFVVPQVGNWLDIPWSLPAHDLAPGDNGGTSPDPNNGHCVPGVGYNPYELSIVTWGAGKGMSWDFYSAYCTEAYAVLSPQWFTANQNAPNGLNLADLLADLRGLK